MEPTPDEVMVTALAAAIDNDSVVYVGAGVPLMLAAASLAKATHAPDATIFAFAGIELRRAMTLTLRAMEGAALACCLTHEIIEILNRTEGYGVVEPLAPAQIAADGSANTLVIGPYEEPKIRLPGFAGTDAIGSMPGHVIYYTTRHTPRVLVDRVDIRMIDGVRVSERRPAAAGPKLLITDLAVLEWAGSGWRVRSVHPGVDWRDLRAQTGFELPERGTDEITPVPDRETLDLIRRKIDPFNLRRLEFAPARERGALLREIAAAERRWLSGGGLSC